MEGKARIFGEDTPRYGISRLKFFASGSHPRALSAPSIRLSTLTLIVALAVIPACDDEPESGAESNNAAKKAAGGASNPKLARYSQAPGAKKVDPNLLRLEQKVRGENLSLRQAALDAGIATMDNGMVLDIVTDDILANDRRKFQLPGVGLRHFSPKYNRVSVIIRDFDQVRKLAALPEVRSIAPEYGAAIKGGSRK